MNRLTSVRILEQRGRLPETIAGGRLKVCLAQRSSPFPHIHNGRFFVPADAEMMWVEKRNSVLVREHFRVGGSRATWAGWNGIHHFLVHLSDPAVHAFLDQGLPGLREAFTPVWFSRLLHRTGKNAGEHDVWFVVDTGLKWKQKKELSLFLWDQRRIREVTSSRVSCLTYRTALRPPTKKVPARFFVLRRTKTGEETACLATGTLTTCHYPAIRMDTVHLLIRWENIELL